MLKKIKFFIDYDKEEKWLNEMAQKGYELVKISFGCKYHFIKEKNSVIRVDCRTFNKKADFINYCTLFEDSGWKHVSGSKYSGAQYFKKISENSNEDIFSDYISKADRYKRLANMYMGFLVVFIILISYKYIDINAILNPKLLYYTPGLWEMNGSKFWVSFLFETPFALLRGFMWLGIVIPAGLYFSYLFKAKSLYNKHKKSNLI